MHIKLNFAVLSATVVALISPGQVWAQSSVPPPTQHIIADCDRPTYASDQLVCGDVMLRQMDMRLAAVLRQANVVRAFELIESDNMWFRRRSRCAFEIEHRSCLIDAYTDRIAVVEAASTPIASYKTAKCNKFSNMRRVLLSHPGHGRIVILDNNKQLIGVASEATKGKVWKPALTFTVSGRNYRFESQDGRRFTCKMG